MVGTYGVRLIVDDGALSSTDDVTVSVSASGTNQPPVANHDAYQVIRNQTLTVLTPGVLGNDSDADGDILSAAHIAGPAQGTLGLASNGSFTYTPAVNFSGTDGFSYAASDGSGGTDIGSVTLTVIAPPVVTFFAPLAGAVGAEVAVHGENLATVQSVTFNGIAADFVVDSDIQLRATVPVGASSGLIAVTNPAGAGSSASVFTVGDAVTAVLIGSALHDPANAISYSYGPATYSNNRLYLCFTNSAKAASGDPDIVVTSVWAAESPGS
jgi:hypothetical protein